jgi:signal peptidase II
MSKRMMHGLGCWLIVSLVIFLDQASKHWVLQHFTPYDPLDVTKFLNITLAFNTGAAFSLLSGPDDWHWWFFIIFTIVMSLGLIIWQWKELGRNFKLACALSLVIGGALSNLWDRLQLGQVVDFIDAHYAIHHWPVFNLADSSICLGAFLLMMLWK